MSAKFVSKNQNYMVVLRPGKEGNRATGTQAVSGLYVKFLSGMVDVKEDSIIELMRSHPDFGQAFIEIEAGETDPYAETRAETEPKHVTQEMKYGHIVKREGAPIATKVTPQIKKLIEAEAMKMIPGLIKKDPELIKAVIVDLAKDMKKEGGNPKAAPKTASRGSKTASKTLEVETDDTGSVDPNLGSVPGALDTENKA